jgi:hypothetical protein
MQVFDSAVVILEPIRNKLSEQLALVPPLLKM